MACYHPLKGFPIGVNPSGKTNYLITSYDAKYVIKSNTDQYLPCYDALPSDQYRKRIESFIEIPCGHCIGCRLKYSSDWASRCMLELKDHEKACFLTLTYNDEHLPLPNQIIDSDGVVTDSPVHPLVKRDLQLFFKRLRKAFSEDKIRYFACGEYGGTSMRPHYHIILYGVDFSDDRKVKNVSKEGYIYYTSDILSKIWTYGFHIITDVTFDSCAYVARYVTKKLNGPAADIYTNYNFPSEFSVMSRRPGIGRSYYDENKEDIYENQEIFISTDKGGKRLRPPRYYDKLFDIEYPERMDDIKKIRLDLAKKNQEMKMSLTSLSYLDMLKSQEENKLAQIKSLKRKEL